MFYPSDEVIKRAAIAAKEGFWVPGDILKEPNPKCQRPFATFIRQLIPVQHAGIWQFRQIPAAAMNELGHLANLA